MKIKNSTTIGSIFTKYPAAQSVIIELLPDFGELKQEHLKNQVLDNITVDHFAQKANLETTTFIKKLEEAAGISQPETGAEEMLKFASSDPNWIQSEPAFQVDGVALLIKGEHPLNLIKSHLEKMSPGNFILLTTNFHPQPMIDAMGELGAEVYSRKDLQDENLHRTFIKA
jgi:hypothetical protein